MELTTIEKTKLSKIRQAKLEILFTDKDQEGNFLVFNIGQLYLRLVNEDRNRKIGSIHYVGDIILYRKWEDSSHIFNKLDAWSIPLLIAKNVDVIHFKTQKRSYWITREDALEKGQIMKFEGIERKIYVPRQYWSEDPIIIEPTTLLAGFTVKKDMTEDKLISRVGESWAKQLSTYFESDYMMSVGKGIFDAREKGVTIYPSGEDVFKAFRMTPYDKVKVVILGQNPYHNGSANGLAFDCSKSNKLNPSMEKIVTGYSQQFPNNFSVDIMNGDLSRWTEEGVLLLNSALTVRKGEPDSHLRHWQPFTEEVLGKLNSRSKSVVYLLWGSIAQQYMPLISNKHPIIMVEHPAAAAYQNRDWIHKECFHVANDMLRNLKIETITW